MNTGLRLGTQGKRHSSPRQCRDREGVFFKRYAVLKKEKNGGEKGPVFAANTCNLLQPLSDKTVLP